MDDREFLEQHVGPCTASYINCGMADSYWAIRKDEDGQEFCRCYCGAMAGASPAWAEARRILEARLKAIAEVEEEMRWLEHYLGGTVILGPPSEKWREPEASVLKRILTREQIHLSALKSGMREE